MRRTAFLKMVLRRLFWSYLSAGTDFRKIAKRFANAQTCEGHFGAFANEPSPICEHSSSLVSCSFLVNHLKRKMRRDRIVENSSSNSNPQLPVLKCSDETIICHRHGCQITLTRFSGKHSHWRQLPGLVTKGHLFQTNCPWWNSKTFSSNHPQFCFSLVHPVGAVVARSTRNIQNIGVWSLLCPYGECSFFSSIDLPDVLMTRKHQNRRLRKATELTESSAPAHIGRGQTVRN